MNYALLIWKKQNKFSERQNQLSILVTRKLKGQALKLVDFRGEQYFNISYSSLCLERARVEMSLLSKDVGRKDELKKYLHLAHEYASYTKDVGMVGNERTNLKEILLLSSSKIDKEEYDTSKLDKYNLTYESDTQFEAQSRLNMARAHLYSFRHSLQLDKSSDLNCAQKYFIEAGNLFQKSGNFLEKALLIWGWLELF